ncbi:alpha/beta hydrolase [Streptomyces sp. NBC_01016]|uniref:alpha/beta hydrolase family protein n=1 Tax=Streptomyces sp. NBC_01016 TaxID=2903720 RepID=UPI002256BE57|nr:alpha/beta hydrolase [Streptomyces sp. NBC_01016]MCX4834680.1 alpha/beta hydrolase [Streptomyces sp. NBC_01016]
MTSRHRSAAVATLLTLTLSAPLLGAAPAVSVGTEQAAPRAQYSSGLELPPLTGPYPVGRRTLHLVDRNRTDPWVPTADGRELMVTVAYPARSARGLPAAYMTDEEAQLLLEARGLGGVVPRETVAGARTRAHVGARPAPGHFPLVLLSPGFSMPRTTLTSLADDLASRGYVVASVDHAYESVGTAFPGGRTLTCVACDRVGTQEEQAAVVRGRAKDMSFVISELTSGRRAGALSHVIDRSRIGIGGHSIGGATAAATMAADRRVRAGVDLDGDFFLHPAAAGLGRRPFMMLGTESTHSPSNRTSDWPEAWKHLNGWKRWFTVAGAEHFSFTDLPYLAGQLGLSDPDVPLSGERGWRITRDYVSAFFDLHLRSIAQPLLDGPTATHPEVAPYPAGRVVR